jgi:arylsulfatase A-like enzyme
MKNIGAGALAMTMAGSSMARSSRKPNIIFILADDLGYGDLGCYGQKIIKTPHIDGLAREGMRFTQHYSGSTVCAPARSCLMTGLHTGHTRVRGNSDVPLKPEDVTVAQLLKKAGYTTGIIGKWGLGEAGSTGIPNRKGFDYWYGYLNQVNAHFYYPPFLWRNEQKVELEGNDMIKQVGQYTHDLFANEALDFIERNKKRPFFLYLPLTIPHAELSVPEDSMEAYKGLFSETPHKQGYYNKQKAPKAAFAGMVSRLDRDVGRIMAQLKKLGLDDNTLVLFTSDNGPHKEGGADPEFFNSSGPLRGIKRDLYEGGIRVPMIAHWPGKIEATSETDHISAFWDFLPTCTEIAGIRKRRRIDGISFLPTLLGKRQREHKYMYWEFHEQGGKQAIRMGNWKGVRLNVKKDMEGPIALYDLGSDLGERRDVSSKHPKVVQEIRTLMKKARTESKDFPFKSG